MIIFDLKCAPQGHVFEAWFGSSADYQDQLARGLIGCPVCGTDAVAKAPMAPSVGAKGNQTGAKAAPGDDSAEPEVVKAMLSADPHGEAYLALGAYRCQ